MKLTTSLVTAALAALLSTSAFAQLQPSAPAATPAPAAKPSTPTPAVKPAEPAKAPTPAPVTVQAPVNINAATADQLDAIPNIGEKRSAAIIKERPYAKTQDLVTKKVLTQGVFEKIKDKVTVNVNLNTATAAELDSLPGIGEKRSDAIIKGRPYKTTSDLVAKKVVSQGVFDKFKSLVTAQ